MTGVKVKYCGHNGWFIADVYKIAGAVVVRASAPINPGNIVRDNQATHHVVDYPSLGFWRPDLGVFVVPENQFTSL